MSRNILSYKLFSVLKLLELSDVNCFPVDGQMSSNKLRLQSGRWFVLLRCDSHGEPLRGSQKFYQYFLYLSHYMQGWVDGCFSIFSLKVSRCIYKRTGYEKRQKAFHRSGIRHTCMYKCAMVKWGEFLVWHFSHSTTRNRFPEIVCEPIQLDWVSAI